MLLKDGVAAPNLAVRSRMLPTTDIAFCMIILVMVWLGVLTVVVGVCISAARGDRALAHTSVVILESVAVAGDRVKDARRC